MLSTTAHCTPRTSPQHTVLVIGITIGTCVLTWGAGDVDAKARLHPQPLLHSLRRDRRQIRHRK